MKAYSEYKAMNLPWLKAIQRIGKSEGIKMYSLK